MNTVFLYKFNGENKNKLEEEVCSFAPSNIIGASPEKFWIYHDWCTDHHVGEKTREIFEKFSAITDAMAEKANIVMCHVLDMEIVMLAVVSIGGIVWMTMPLFKMGLVGIIFGLALIIVVVIMSAVCLHSWFSGEEK